MQLAEENMGTVEDAVAIVETLERDELLKVIAAINARQKRLNILNSAQLQVGMRVRTVHITPAYLKGLTGTITGFKGLNIVVVFDHPINWGKYNEAKQLTMPPSCVDPL